MQTPQSSDHNIAIATSSRLPGQSRLTSNSAQSTKPNNIERRLTDSQPPSAKRLKTFHSAGNTSRQADMIKGKGVVSRPGFVDLTRQPQFDPQSGVKRLVIKNLRISSPRDADEYYNRVWKELDSALTSVCIFQSGTHVTDRANLNMI